MTGHGSANIDQTEKKNPVALLVKLKIKGNNKAVQ